VTLSYTITTLGCKVNRYESEAMGEALEARGWRPCGTEAGADLFIVNTCTVTGKAAAQSRQAIRKAIRAHDRATMVVTGCGAQRDPEGLAAIPGVDYVVGNSFKADVARILPHTRRSSPDIRVADIRRVRRFQDLPITRFGDRTRSFVKIQDGCDAFCSYCIVPYVRGPSRSLASATVRERLGDLQAAGYAEAVLCGIHLGRYGQDLTPATSLLELLRSVDRLPAAPRLRLSSIEPLELSDPLIDHVARSPRLCPHFHIPLQSGDDAILAAMHRPYDTAYVAGLVDRITRTLPEAAVGMDVLVGFPGETPEAFERTCALIRRLPVSYLHVFPYSPREGTAAAALPDPVPPSIIKQRCTYLRRLGAEKRKAFYQACVGRTGQVIFEEQRDRVTGRLKGFTDNYIPVIMEGRVDRCGRITEVRLDRIEKNRMVAKALS